MPREEYGAPVHRPVAHFEDAELTEAALDDMAFICPVTNSLPKRTLLGQTMQPPYRPRRL
jgi:hypothetical protein